MTLRTAERWLTAASWIASIVHVVWFYFDQRADSPTMWAAMRACMDMGYWWQFVQTRAGAISGIAAIVLAIAQSVVMVVRIRRGGEAAAG